jgi:hypothetical protein
LGFNESGFNESGFNELGFNESGFNELGFNELGFNKSGFNESGFNESGFNESGFNELGFNKSGFNESGFNNKLCPVPIKFDSCFKPYQANCGKSCTVLQGESGQQFNMIKQLENVDMEKMTTLFMHIVV